MNLCCLCLLQKYSFGSENGPSTIRSLFQSINSSENTAYGVNLAKYVMARCADLKSSLYLIYADYARSNRCAKHRVESS